MADQETIKQKPKWEEKLDSKEESGNFLILFNDDVNSFTYVIESLIEVCKHNIEQAEQCTYIAHFKGKCDVKRGSIEELKPYKYGLIDKGLTVSIE